MLKSKPNDEECDATDDDSSAKVDIKINRPNEILKLSKKDEKVGTCNDNWIAAWLFAV
jgi:hypothetical protein